jgi:hypothetical protein
MGEPVLVFDRKVVKQREGVLRRVLPSLVRLQFLDDCLRVSADVPYFVAAFPRGCYELAQEWLTNADNGDRRRTELTE